VKFILIEFCVLFMNEWLLQKMSEQPRVSILLPLKCCQHPELQRCRVMILWATEEEEEVVAAPVEAHGPTGAPLRVTPAACWRSSKKCDSGPAGFFPLATSPAPLSGLSAAPWHQPQLLAAPQQPVGIAGDQQSE